MIFVERILVFLHYVPCSSILQGSLIKKARKMARCEVIELGSLFKASKGDLSYLKRLGGLASVKLL